jgi:2,3,4,5-tetrahydropyridine-2-carboxylate N-succinyltransferase
MSVRHCRLRIRWSAQTGSRLRGQVIMGKDETRSVETVAVRAGIGCLADPPVDAHGVYLRFQLLSHRLVRPYDLSLECLFSCWPTWRGRTPAPAR